MNKAWKRIGLGLISIGLVLVLLVSGVVPQVTQAGPAEKERAVKIGLHSVLTGGLATTGVPVSKGQFDYIRYINEQGGIDGVKVEAVWEDSGVSSAKVVMAHKRFVEAGVVVETCLEATMVEAMRSRLIRDETPCMYIAGVFAPYLMTGATQWVVGAGVEGENYFINLAAWIKENWTEERPPRLGFIQIEPWKDVVRPAIPYIEKLGVEVVFTEYGPLYGVIDFTPVLIRTIAKSPDWVVVGHYAGNMVVLAKDIQRLELQQKGIKFIVDQASMEEATVRVIGKAAEGWYKMVLLPTASMTEWPGIKIVLQVAKKYRGMEPEEIPLYYILGWVPTLIALEGIRLAIEQVGFENLSGRAVRDALFNISDFDTGLLPPATITEDKPFYNEYEWYGRFEQGKLVPVTDWHKVRRVIGYSPQGELISIG